MIILIFLTFIHFTLNQKIEQTYSKVQGFQSFEIKNITINGFPKRSKITISIAQIDGDKPILLLCLNKPNANISMDYDSITKEQCQYDTNAFENDNKKQVISLLDEIVMKKYHVNFNIYEFQQNGQFIGALSKLQSTYKIQAEIISIYACSKECKNGGICFYGICECLEGTFGDDCSIQGFDIQKQSILQSDYLYYLDIKKITEMTFVRSLSNSISLSQQCYANNPLINHGIQVLTNLIQIDHNRIENCKNITNQIQDMMKIQQNPYYLFKITNQNNAEIFQNDIQETGISKILLILFIPVSILLFLLIICCCYKLCKYKDNLQQQQLQTEPQPTFIDLYIPTQKFKEIKENEFLPISTDYSNCSICLENFDLLNNVKMTYCKHLFHSKCLKLWIEKIKICPLCRAPQDEQTILSMQPPKSMTLIDQISNKSINKLKPSSGSLSFYNNQNQKKFQTINNQRSLVFIDQ